MSFRSVLRFQVKPGRQRDFEDAFANAGMLTRPTEVPGFLDGQLIRAVDDDGDYVVVARWTSAEAYREWQSRSLGDVDPDALDRLFDTLVDPRSGVLYEVVQSSGRDD